MFPKLMATFADRIFFPKDFDFFINMLTDLVQQRSNSTEASLVLFVLVLFIKDSQLM